MALILLFLTEDAKNGKNTLEPYEPERIIMLLLIAQAVYFILPAYLANMMPPIAGKLKIVSGFNQPIDGGKKWGDQYLFGQNKTWRGLFFAVLGGILMAFIQALLYGQPNFQQLSIIDYSQHWLIFGFLAGLGAILGDLAKSFFKRRVGIKSGGAWPIFDQLDFIAGFLIFTYSLAQPDWKIILSIMIMTLILHPLTNIIGYLIGFKKVWW